MLVWRHSLLLLVTEWVIRRRRGGAEQREQGTCHFGVMYRATVNIFKIFNHPEHWPRAERMRVLVIGKAERLNSGYGVADFV